MPVSAEPAADLTGEILAGEGLYLAAAARLLPSTRKDRSVTASCLFRWITRGARVADGRRVRLEATQIAGKWLTTRGALRRFLEAQVPQGSSAQPPPVTSPAARSRAHRRATEVLEREYGM